MRSLRKVMLGAAAATLALTALGAPASAADTTGTLAIVQGHPGVKVDICIGNKEQRSGQSYGKVYQKDVIGTGSKLLRFFKYNPGKNCGGTLIAKKRLNITAGSDWTIVLTKKSPRIVMFDNASPVFLGEIPPRGADFPNAPIAHRSAADFDTNFQLEYWDYGGGYPIGPAADPIWSKGGSYDSIYITDLYVRIRATKPEQTDTVAARTAYLRPGVRYEWILLGTYPGNARMVLIKRGVSLASA